MLVSFIFRRIAIRRISYIPIINNTTLKIISTHPIINTAQTIFFAISTNDRNIVNIVSIPIVFVTSLGTFTPEMLSIIVITFSPMKYPIVYIKPNIRVNISVMIFYSSLNLTSPHSRIQLYCKLIYAFIIHKLHVLDTLRYTNRALDILEMS